jgi:hypothetical protein
MFAGINNNRSIDKDTPVDNAIVDFVNLKE